MDSSWQDYLRECSKRYQAEKAKANAKTTHKLNLPRGYKKDESKLDHMPSVIVGLHPIKQEKEDAERIAMTKRIKGQNPDEATERYNQVESGRRKIKK